jgi:ABC-type dipeptide/oligopeptide/nickel transport system permease component
MGWYVLQRLIQLVPVLLGISTMLFFLLRMSGDPVYLLVGDDASPEVVARIRHAYGFDKPVLQQYGEFLAKAVVLDFGDSIRANQPASRQVLNRLPATLQLSLVAMALAIVVALPLGIISAIRRGGGSSALVMLGALFGQSVPSFALGIYLILIFGVTLHWLPTFGYGRPENLILPAITLAALPMARYARLMRSEMLEVLGQDYIRTAYAKGLGPVNVVRSHALKNALIPVVTQIGLDFGLLFAGSVIIETIFAWPGVGRLLIESAQNRDYPVVQATVFMIASVVVIANLLVDLLYRWLDPRIGLDG